MLEEKKETKELKENDLNKVSGGESNNYIRADYGDVDIDSDPNNSMYKVGMWVELYQTVFHVTTEQCQIAECKFNKEKRYWEYGIDFLRYRGTKIVREWYTADDIQRATGKWEPHN